MHQKIGLIIAFMALLTMQGLAAGKFVLVIDAGHGGKDPGALGKISQEKNINLQVALALGNYVERNCPDVKVIYTRKTDVFIELNERANIANRNKADLFISLHTNALDGGKISRGVETYTLGMHRAADNLNVAKRENSVILIEKNYKQTYAGFDPNSAESYIMFEILQDKNMANSVELAKTIQSEVCSSSGRNNKGVHQAGFLVLRETSMPSCLIEMGFITTSDEEEFLNTKEGQDKIAKGIFNAFVKYKKKFGTKMAQNDELPQTDEQEPLDGSPMDVFASNIEPMEEVGMGEEMEDNTMQADGDTHTDGNHEEHPSASIVEQDNNLYAVTEYAQPRAVRNIETSTNTDIKPQEPIPLSLPEETALHVVQQQTNPAQTNQIPAKNPSDTQPATSNQPAAPKSKIAIDDENVLATNTTSKPSKTTTEAIQMTSHNTTSQNTPSHTLNQTVSTVQKPEQPSAPEQTASTVQKPEQPSAPKQTASIIQKPEQPSAPKQTANTIQKPEQPSAPKQTARADDSMHSTSKQPAKPGMEKQQADIPNTNSPVLHEVTAPPQGTVLEGKTIFKVQIAATKEPKNVNDEFFQGLKNIDAYMENGMVKYTIGATHDFAEVENLRNTLLDKFPGAFIIAFRDGYKIPLQNALREYRKQKK